MKVSIVIPIFNAEKYLDACLSGLTGQSYKDLEIILVNDGSADKSLDICRMHEQRDARIKVISKDKSEGAGPARNSGIDNATGDYLMFLDADDRISEHMVEKLLSAVTEADADVAVCAYSTFIEGTSDKNDEIFRMDASVLKTKAEVRAFFASLFPEGFAGYLWNKIYKAELIHKNNLRFPPMRRLQDGVFNVEFFDCAEKCVIIEDVLYNYRVNAQTDLFKKCPKNYFELIKQFSLSYLDAKKNWGDFSNRKIVEFFLNELGNCIENTYSPQWNMTKNERKAYLKALKEDELFKFAYESEYSVGKYRLILLKLLKNERFAAITLTVNCKIVLKTGMKKVFYFLKRMKKHG